MGWATLGGATLVLLFWTLYFASGLDLGQTDPVVSAFESAFPIADAIFCIALFAAGFCLLSERGPGAYFLAISGAISVYLGALDLTFYGARGAYFPISGEGLFQLSLSLICIGVGTVALVYAWRFWREETAVR
jgi:hypothetical protein